MKCDVTSKDVIAQLKPKKNALSKLFASGNYKGYDDVMEMLGGKKWIDIQFKTRCLVHVCSESLFLVKIIPFYVLCLLLSDNCSSHKQTIVECLYKRVAISLCI